MTARVTTSSAVVTSRVVLSDHLVRLTLQAPDLVSTGIPDEWLSLTVPGQFQTRYYTIRSLHDHELTLDVVIHESGLVTQWAQTDCVGDEVTISAPKGSYAPPEDAAWVVLVGDLTALPAIARIVEHEQRPVSAYVEAPDDTHSYPDLGAVTWLPADPNASRLAEHVAGMAWPEGAGYFWMAGESAQMREVRRWSRGRFDHAHMDAMGYWSGARGRQTRRVDPGPIYAKGKALGKTDEEIWADYDEANK